MNIHRIKIKYFCIHLVSYFTVVYNGVSWSIMWVLKKSGTIFRRKQYPHSSERHYTKFFFFILIDLVKLGHIRQHCASSVWKKESFFLWVVYSHEHKLEGGCDVACSRAHRPTITVTEDPMTQIEVVAGPEVKVLASVWKKKK